jgi:hypothetical protein
VIPTFAIDDSLYRGFRNVEHYGQLFVRVLSAWTSYRVLFCSVKIANFLHLLFCQFRIAVSRAVMRFGALETVFVDAVCCVFCWRSQEQMIRAYATRIIALVANFHPLRNFSKVKLPRIAVSIYSCARFAVAQNETPSVPSFSYAGAFPIPTAQTFFNFEPKTLLGWSRWAPDLHGAGV